MRHYRLFFSVLLLCIAVSVCAQCRYCKSYEEFRAGQWTVLDTVNCIGRSKSQKVWAGGNDYKLTRGDYVTDKMLKEDAFAVMVGDTIYVNMRNLRFEKSHFGSGYCKAIHIGQDTLLFVNQQIGKDVKKRMMIGGMFGAVGGAIAASGMAKQQVCYIICEGADSKGRIPIQMIDDKLVKELMSKGIDLYKEYYSEKDDRKRIRATHVIPILKKAGVFETGESLLESL